MQSIPVTLGTPLVGRVISGLAALFVIMDGVVKLIAPQPVVDSMHELGYPERLTAGIGILLLACIALYLYPRTAMLGAVLMTGYLGGAIASQLRIEAPLFSLVFPLIIGTLLWGGLYLRDERLRTLVAPRN